MRFTTFRIVLILGTAVLAGWGCGADTFNTDTATIVGRVENRAGDPIPEIQIGVIYQAALQSPVPRPAGPEGAAAGPSLGLAYPNPLTDNGGGVRIPLTGVADTTLAVEIRSEFGGVAGVFRHLFAGPVTADTSLVWDGEDDGHSLLAANGRYTIRLIVPADAPAGTSTQEAVFVVNRSQAIIDFTQAYNASSDFDGQFVLEDLGVGAYFAATNASGTPLGQALLINQVTLTFRDPQQLYFADQTTVAVGPRESVDVTKVLEPTTAAPRPQAVLR